MNSVGNPHYKLQEHRVTNEDSFHPDASQRNTVLSNEKTHACRNALKLKKNIYTEKNIIGSGPI